MKKLPTKSVRMWIARDKNNSLYLYRHEPYKLESAGVWAGNYGLPINMNEGLFPSVKWEDDQPTRVSLRLV